MKQQLIQAVEKGPMRKGRCGLVVNWCGQLLKERGLEDNTSCVQCGL